MGNDTIIGIALIAVGGFFVYKYFIQPKSKDTTPTPSSPPPQQTTNPGGGTMTSPPPPPVVQQQQQQQVNNYYYDYISRYPDIHITPQNKILLINFDKKRYASSKDYRDYIQSLLEMMTESERDYWNHIIKRIKIKCVQNVMCAMGTHWNHRKCKCIQNSNIYLPIPQNDEPAIIDVNLSAFSRVRI